MPSDYEAITRDNIRRRGEEFDDIVNFLAEKLYGDRAHFIYELLQNAEDALALRREKDPDTDFSGEVTFRLCRDHLEVSHYGELFDEDDVKGICDVLRGTKNERLDQIGTFGIGFKSVYAFTRSPEVHSGDEHFVIRRYIRPQAVEPRPLQDPLQTLFYFPFDHPKFGESDAFDLIQSKLKSLGPRSLLFLHHVKELRWIVEGSGSGFYMREPSENGGALVQIMGEGTNQEDTEEEWLIVDRDVKHPSRPEKLSVKVAYSIAADRDGISIVSLHRSPLTVFFPTARETGLGFLIHGPFASTPARDNIESDSTWNDLLLNELATLVSDSLSVCRQHELLTPQFLTVLPIDPESFPEESPFRPIYDAVLKAFKTQSLIPQVGGGHINADRAVLGRSQELRDLLSPTLLTELLGTSSQTKHWVDAAITENRFPIVWQYLRDECDVPVLDGTVFSRQITDRFLEARDEQWMVSFYSFLNRQEALWRPRTYGYFEGLLRKKAIIRCQDGRHRAPFDRTGNPLVFLPAGSKPDYHVVHRSIYAQEKAKEFMHRLGLVAPDICTRVINDILPLYQEDDSEIDDETHKKHLSVISDAMAMEDSPRYTAMLSKLKATRWALATNARTRKRHYTAPNDLFFPSSELQAFFEGNGDVSFLAKQEEQIDWQKLGVRSGPVIHCKGLNTKHGSFVVLRSYHGWHEHGYDGFDPETKIDGLDHALANITRPKAAYIWNDLLPPIMRFLHGRYQTATHQNYDNATSHQGDSCVCKMLKSHAWIPVQSGEFKKPAECTLADFAGELKRNDDLAEILGVHPDPVEVAEETLDSEQSLVAAGFPPEVAILLVSNKEVLTPEFINEFLASHAEGLSSQPPFPEQPVRNKGRRVNRVRERTQKADPKTYDKRKRSVRTSKPEIPTGVWLREMYTNQEGTTVCQMCCKAMPFKLPRTGEYYFEAVQIADNFSVEDHCLHLALCPLCAAKYKVLVKRDEDYLKEFIWAIEVAEGDVVSVEMDGNSCAVRFVETHLLDVRTALSECLS